MSTGASWLTARRGDHGYEPRGVGVRVGVGEGLAAGAVGLAVWLAGGVDRGVGVGVPGMAVGLVAGVRVTGVPVGGRGEGVAETVGRAVPVPVASGFTVAVPFFWTGEATLVGVGVAGGRVGVKVGRGRIVD